ncbi:Integral membrane protein OS=Streptomyces tendae OX=1932 GN=GUR47_36550 PE=4 SV=1 [Streptomyces tendae]
MGTKTVDETGVKTDEHETDEAARPTGSTEVTKADGAPEAAGTDTPEGADAGTVEDTDGSEGTGAGPAGVGQGAGAVVSAGLGIVSLTGSWVGTVASARESLMGQLQTSSSSNVGTLIEKGYGNAWQATAMWGGIFALVALIVGVVVLARPAFGAPGRPQAPWIKSVAWAGVALGVIGLLLAVLKYTDVLLGLPAAG